jgi:hypothetical protein
MLARALTAVVGMVLLVGVALADDRVEVKTYGPYFEKNTSTLKGDVSYVVVTEKKAFNNTFGSGFTTGKKPTLIPDDTFKDDLVVAVIRRGTAIYTYEVGEATLKDGVLTFRFKSTKKAGGGTAKFSSPLIVTVPKKGVTSVTFVENGKKALTVKVGG